MTIMLVLCAPYSLNSSNIGVLFPVSSAFGLVLTTMTLRGHL